MTTRKELVEALRERYRSAAFGDRIKILDEFVALTGYHRKFAQGVRALRCDTEPPFAAILLGGLAGGLIGYSLVRVQCSGQCAAGRGLGAFVGAAVAAIGMSVVAVLVLRALGEWRDIEDRRRQTGQR